MNRRRRDDGRNNHATLGASRARVTIPIVGVARPGGEQVLRICTGQKVGKEVPPLARSIRRVIAKLISLLSFSRWPGNESRSPANID